MKKSLKTLLIFLILFIQPYIFCNASSNSLDTNQQLISYIDELKTIYNNLYLNGKSVYTSKFVSGDYSQLQNDINKETSKIDDLRLKLTNLMDNSKLSNIEKRNALSVLIGVGYYKLANNELNNFINNNSTTNIINLNSYFNYKYTGYSTLNWIESQLKS